MRKILITLLFISIIFSAKAQNLEAKIPNNVDAIVVVNGKSMLELVSLIDIDSSAIGKEILKDVNRRRENKIASIGDLGFDFNSEAFYFLQSNDSVTYNNFMVKLNNKDRFESLLTKRDREKIKTENGVNYMIDYSNITVWNDKIMLVVDVNRSRNYFDKNRDRLKKQLKEDESEYNGFKKIAQNWAKNNAIKIITTTPASSIASNANYKASKQKGAEATVWLRNYGQMMGKLMSSMGGLYSPSYLVTGNSNFYGIDQVYGNLFFEKDAMRLSLDMELTDEMGKAYKKIYNKKMSSKFFNHFDQSNVLAFWSVTFNTKAFLEEYPNMVNKIYGGMLPEYKDEVQLSADLFSLLIDEEAIGDLLTGDMLFVLNDFGEQDVEYKDYEYDEEYNRKEVTKTKKELVPDFTIMIGSREKEFLNKLYRLGAKHKVIDANAGVFEFILPKRDFPFKLYSTLKDDILFLTTSKTRAKNIVSNKKYATNGAFSKLIKKNSSVLYVDGQKIAKVVPEKELSRKDKKMLNLFTKSFEDAEFKTSKVKSNKVSSEFKINTSGKEENSLKLLLEFIETISKY